MTAVDFWGQRNEEIGPATPMAGYEKPTQYQASSRSTGYAALKPDSRRNRRTVPKVSFLPSCVKLNQVGYIPRPLGRSPLRRNEVSRMATLYPIPRSLLRGFSLSARLGREHPVWARSSRSRPAAVGSPNLTNGPTSSFGRSF